MKKYYLGFCFIVMMMMQSCFYLFDFGGDSPAPLPESQYAPVYMSRADFDGSIRYSATPVDFQKNEGTNGKAITKIGKIYSYPPYIFINQLNEGFHIVDNSDPKKPKRIGFIYAPGSTDMVIKNNVILLNHATDLISLSWDINNIKEEKRIKNIFPQKLTPDGRYVHDVNENQIIIGFKKRKS